MKDQIEKFIAIADKWWNWINGSIYEYRCDPWLTGPRETEGTRRLEREEREWRTCMSGWVDGFAPKLPSELTARLFKLGQLDFYSDIGKSDVKWPDIRAELQAFAARPLQTREATYGVLTQDQQEVLDEIPTSPHTKMAAEIALSLGKSPEDVRSIVKRLRAKGLNIHTEPGAGYCRPVTPTDNTRTP